MMFEAFDSMQDSEEEVMAFDSQGRFEAPGGPDRVALAALFQTFTAEEFIGGEGDDDAIRFQGRFEYPGGTDRVGLEPYSKYSLQEDSVD